MVAMATSQETTWMRENHVAKSKLPLMRVYLSNFDNHLDWDVNPLLFLKLYLLKTVILPCIQFVDPSFTKFRVFNRESVIVKQSTMQLTCCGTTRNFSKIRLQSSLSSCDYTLQELQHVATSSNEDRFCERFCKAGGRIGRTQDEGYKLC